MPSEGVLALHNHHAVYNDFEAFYADLPTLLQQGALLLLQFGPLGGHLLLHGGHLWRPRSPLTSALLLGIRSPPRSGLAAPAYTNLAGGHSASILPKALATAATVPHASS